MRQRNGILIFIEDGATRTLFSECLIASGWNVFATDRLELAIARFGTFGDDLALVLADDQTGPSEGRFRGMLGAKLFEQQKALMGASNVPFVYLMYMDREWLRRLVSDSGGFVVRMPKSLRELEEILCRLEEKHSPPSKSWTGEL